MVKDSPRVRVFRTNGWNKSSSSSSLSVIGGGGALAEKNKRKEHEDLLSDSVSEGSREIYNRTAILDPTIKFSSRYACKSIFAHLYLHQPFRVPNGKTSIRK